MHHFSALAGGMALSLMLIPITARSTEQFLLEVPRAMREGSLALGANKWRTIATRDRAGGAQGHHDRHDSGRGAHLRRNGAAAVHQSQQSVLEHGPFRADGVAAGHDLQLRHHLLTKTGTARRGPPVWFCWRSYCSLILQREWLFRVEHRCPDKGANGYGQSTWVHHHKRLSTSRQTQMTPTRH